MEAPRITKLPTEIVCAGSSYLCMEDLRNFRQIPNSLFESQSRSEREVSAGVSDTSDASSAALTQFTNTTITSTGASTQSSWHPKLVITQSDMPTTQLHDPIGAMRSRDEIHDLRELTITYTFKITEDEFVELLPSLIDGAGLTEYLEERLQFEYVALT
ncbi:hypothetical protein LTR17_013351 [Elasticomyces elasticus]|nr:hypothetical protein LTR17_013351 [Elasticomyces elasticus]